MTWFSPVLVSSSEDRFPGAPATWAIAPGMGSAVAGRWSWSSAERTEPNLVSEPATLPADPRGVRLRAPVETLRLMSEAARMSGRSESEVWVEAAREWLRHHDLDIPPASPAPQGSAMPGARPRRLRDWGAIDALLDNLRDGSPAA